MSIDVLIIPKSSLISSSYIFLLVRMAKGGLGNPFIQTVSICEVFDEPSNTCILFALRGGLVFWAPTWV